MEQIGPQGEIRSIIHFVYQEGERWRIACMPNMSDKEFGTTKYHPQVLHSNDMRAVTCSFCKSRVGHGN